MANILEILPELNGEEMVFIESIIKDYDNEKGHQFASAYRARRKDPQLILITALIGFLGFSGIHRFLLNDILMGVLYFFTGGLCLIGTIVDLINYQKLAFDFNRNIAIEISNTIQRQ